MPISYKINQGDTLGAIAAKHGTSVADLVAANKGNPSVKSADLIVAGGNLNLPEKVAAPAGGPATGTGLAAGALDPNSAAQSAGASQVGQLGNLRMAMRAALNEAGKNRVASNYQQVTGATGGAVPGSVGSVVDMIRSGPKASVESIFSDTLKSLEDAKKELEVNPADFKSVQGGLFNVKTNEWVINPKSPTGSGSKGTKITRSDAQSLELPVSLVGSTWNMLMEQVNSPAPPSWFRAKAESGASQSMESGQINVLWDEFRRNFDQSFVKDEDEGGVNFDDL